MGIKGIRRRQDDPDLSMVETYYSPEDEDALVPSGWTSRRVGRMNEFSVSLLSSDSSNLSIHKTVPIHVKRRMTRDTHQRIYITGRR